MLKKLVASFSSTATSFKSKGKLTDFYKAIHPDILNNAPDNVKTENSRSLKMLNGYFDAVAQNQQTEAQELVFYVANKQNTKARKFYPITIQLDAYLQNNADHTIDSVTKQIMDKLHNKQSEIQTEHLKKREKPGISESEFEAIKSNFLKETTFIRRKQDQKEEELQTLKLQVFSNQNRTQFEEIEKNIIQSLRQANMPHVKPGLWMSILEEHRHEPIQNLTELLNKLIDPRLIFIDHKLAEAEVKEFMELIMPKSKTEVMIEKLSRVFKDMEMTNPQICLYVTKSYGYRDIPGYFSIPFNFGVEELTRQYLDLKDLVLQQRVRFDKELSNYDELVSQFANQFQITNLENRIPIKNAEILQELNLSLLTLSKQLSQVSEARLSRMREKHWVLTGEVEQSAEDTNSIYVKIPFSGVI